MSSGPQTPNEWSQHTRDIWFYGALVASTAALIYLFSPYLFVLLFAAVTVVVTWPLYEWVLSRTKRPAVSAVATTLLLAVVVFGPVVFVIYLFTLEAVEVAERVVTFVRSGRLEDWFLDIQGRVTEFEDPRVHELVGRLLPEDFDPIATFMEPLKDGVLASLNTAGNLIPRLIGVIVGGSIDAVIFVFAVVSLYMEGPTVLNVIRKLSPIDDRYERRLFNVFRQFAMNMVVGSVATATVQGIVAGIGYAIAGVDGVIFFAIVTAVCSFVPLIGTSVVWLPLSINIGIHYGIGWGVFLAVWSIAFTGTVDNVLKPLFLRGSSNIHPLLIFLAVFGGLMWMKLPGVLVGPVLVAFFLALYTIYCEDYLGEKPKAPSPEVKAPFRG
ncbi:MAG: AI-2E family transporter [Proteobacteria bacterium]|nr:AI-2E family transporter [Pseudomonadota bacterium]